MKMTGKVTLTHPGFFDHKTELYIFKTNLASVFAKNLINQAGEKRTVKDPIQFGDTMDSFELFMKHKFAKYIIVDGSNPMYRMTAKELIEALEEEFEKNPKIRIYNYSSNDLHKDNPDDRPQFSFTDRYSDNDPNSDDNFVDLGALARNIVNDLIYDHQILHND